LVGDGGGVHGLRHAADPRNGGGVGSRWGWRPRAVELLARSDPRRHGLFYDPALDPNRGGIEQGAAAARSGGGGRWRHGGEGGGEGRRGGIAARGGGWMPWGTGRFARCAVRRGGGGGAGDGGVKMEIGK
jgi:hypothetical protein